jgi:hypothetical protein
VFEAAAVGTISVVSPSFALKRAVDDGRTGFVAPAHRWRSVLDRAIARLDDGYPEMAEAAAQAAVQRYVPAVQGPVVIHSLFGNQATNPDGARP